MVKLPFVFRTVITDLKSMENTEVQITLKTKKLGGL